MKAYSSTLLKWAGRALLVLYVFMAALLIAVRYWVLPNIDQWRPQIETQLSRMLDTNVLLGDVQGHWHGLRPQLQLRNLQFLDDNDSPQFEIGSLTAQIAWRSVLFGRPVFHRLSAEGMAVDVVRAKDGRLHFLGRVDDDQGAGAGLAWVLAHGHVNLSDTSLRWQDLTRDAPPLLLEGVDLNLRNTGSRHRFSIVARTPGELASALEIRGDLTSTSDTPRVDTLSGKVYVAGEGVDLPAWSPWTSVPDALPVARMSAKLWLELQDGRPQHVTVDASAQGVQGQLHDGVEARVQEIHLWASGPWTSYTRLKQVPVQAGHSAALPYPLPPVHTADDDALRLWTSIAGLQVRADIAFDHELRFDRVDVLGKVSDTPMGIRLHAQDLLIENDDMELHAEGYWWPAGSSPAGTAQFTGRFERAAMSAIDDYLPRVVNLEAREWMDKALLQGQIHRANVVLEGDLRNFPFGDYPERGDFQVEGPFENGVMDYLPAEPGEAGWPRMDAMQGWARLHRVDLHIMAEEATMSPQPGHTIQLRDVYARIPNIEEDPVLTIRGETSAAATAYLALLRNTPLNEWTGAALEQAQAEGRWEVPLNLNIPITLPAAHTTVEGSVKIANSNFRWRPQAPQVQSLTGTVHFTQDNVSAQDLEGSALGGKLIVEGGLGAPYSGFRLTGTATAEALSAYAKIKALERISGTMPYEIFIQRNAQNKIAVTGRSDLVGAAINMPAPFGKAKDRSLPLKVEWLPEDSRHRLNIALGDALTASLLQPDAAKPSDPLFAAGGIAIGDRPSVPESGLHLRVQYPHIDGNEWETVIRELSAEPSRAAGKLPTKGAVQRPMLPPLRRIQIQTKQGSYRGVDLEDFKFTAERAAARHWHVTIDSANTAGRLDWYQQRNGKPGGVVARFDRLSIGRTDDDESSRSEADAGETLDDDSSLDIPEVELHVNALTLYGRPVGQLTVKGLNQERGRRWRLESLRLATPSAELTGSGTWQLEGESRGLRLDATARFSDLGAYLRHMGYENLVKGGTGQVRGLLAWRNMPWEFELEDLSGALSFDLEKGSFSSVESRSAKLLELLSLQSLKRIAKRDLNPKGVAGQGFTFDHLLGDLALKDGNLHTDNYRVIGPAATIVIEGNVDLTDEHFDLRAAVVPNLDVSGAAVAAGVAINPIVGVGAFIAQLLLQQPIAEAMTSQYRITGPLSDPVLQEISKPPAEQPRRVTP